MGTVNSDNFADAAGTGAPLMTNGVKLPTSGGTKGTLDFYEEYTDDITAADLTVHTGGGSLSAVSGTLKLTRVGRIVVMTLDNFAFTTSSSANGVDFVPGYIPSRFLPSNNVGSMMCDVGDGGTGIFWGINVATNGSTVFATKDNAGTNTAIADASYTKTFTMCWTL